MTSSKHAMEKLHPATCPEVQVVMGTVRMLSWAQAALVMAVALPAATDPSPPLSDDEEPVVCGPEGLSVCLATVYREDCFVMSDGEEEPLSLPSIGLERLPRYGRGIPPLVIASVEGPHCCGSSGNCPHLVMARKGNKWRQVFYHHGTILKALPSWRVAGWPSLVGAQHEGAFHWTWTLYTRSGDGWKALLQEERIGDNRPCLTTDGTISLFLKHWCRAAMEESIAFREQAEEGGPLEILVRDHTDQPLAAAILPPQCYQDSLGNRRFIVFELEEEDTCRPVLVLEGLDWMPEFVVDPPWDLDSWLFVEQPDEAKDRYLMSAWGLDCAGRLERFASIFEGTFPRLCLQTVEGLGAGEVGLTTWLLVDDTFRAIEAFSLLVL